MLVGNQNEGHQRDSDSSEDYDECMHLGKYINKKDVKDMAYDDNRFITRKDLNERMSN